MSVNHFFIFEQILIQKYQIKNAKNIWHTLLGLLWFTLSRFFYSMKLINNNKKLINNKVLLNRNIGDTNMFNHIFIVFILFNQKQSVTKHFIITDYKIINS